MICPSSVFIVPTVSLFRSITDSCIELSSLAWFGALTVADVLDWSVVVLELSLKGVEFCFSEVLVANFSFLAAFVDMSCPYSLLLLLLE